MIEFARGKCDECEFLFFSMISIVPEFVKCCCEIGLVAEEVRGPSSAGMVRLSLSSKDEIRHPMSYDSVPVRNSRAWCEKFPHSLRRW